MSEPNERRKILDNLARAEHAEGLYDRETERDREPHPEEYCHECGGSNISWFISSDMWNYVTERRSSILCVNCFVKKAEQKGIDTTWELRRDPLLEPQPAVSERDRELTRKIADHYGLCAGDDVDEELSVIVARHLAPERAESERLRKAVAGLLERERGYQLPTAKKPRAALGEK